MNLFNTRASIEMTKNHPEICFKIANLNVLLLKWSRHCAHHVENVIVRGEHRIWEKSESPELNCYPNNLFLFEKCQLSMRSSLFVWSYHLFPHRKCTFAHMNTRPKVIFQANLTNDINLFFLRKFHINIFLGHTDTFN